MARSKADPGKRDRILDAAVRVFAEKGYRGARVSDVAREAGVADGTIYLYFDNKDALLTTIFEEKMAAIIAEAEARMETLDGPLEKLRFFIENHLRVVDENPALAEVMLVELRFSDKFLKEYDPEVLWRYMTLLSSVISAGQETGLFRAEIPASLAAGALFGALDEVSLHRTLARRRQTELKSDSRTTASALYELLVGGLRAT
jgi:TetR/AcrR family fatty acid metabolism transcriptional regulator